MLPAMLAPFPEVPPEQRGSAQGHLRYEDVAQDGRLVLTALAHFMGQAVFMGPIRQSEGVRETAHAGIVPIVSRMLIEGGDGPVSVRKPVDVAGGFELTHTVDETGAVNRLILNTFAAMQAPAGRTHPPAPPNAGTLVAIGRVFVEHVFTRPFAPAGARKVSRFPPGPWPEVPPKRQEWRPPGAVLELPPGATAVDELLAPDEAVTALGLAHTDSNQHVNSLVYPRLFEEALLRRLAARGRSTAVLARASEVAYRKPLFAGDRARIWLRLYDGEHGPGAVGVFVRDGDDTSRPHATVRLEMA
jgi:hypothetical protein